MKTPLQVGPTLLALLAVWIFVTPSFAQEIETLQKGVVKIRPISLETSAQTCTGFIVRRGADVVYIITALHVVIGARDAEVEFFTQRNRLVQAKVLQQEGDDERGLAVLAVQGNIPTDVVVLKMNRGGLLRAGDPVTMIGFPDAGGPWAVTKGEIVGRKAKSIVFSGAIEKGNSGGPLIHEGQVIGVVTQTQSPFSYAAPTVIAQYVLESWGVKFGDQLRSKPATVEPGYVVQMIREKGFNHPGDMSKEGGSGYVRGNFQHEYELQTLNGIEVVIDRATDLM
jgi:S1-C subfamily serine protease